MIDLRITAKRCTNSRLFAGQPGALEIGAVALQLDGLPLRVCALAHVEQRVDLRSSFTDQIDSLQSKEARDSEDDSIRIRLPAFPAHVTNRFKTPYLQDTGSR